MLGGHCRCSDVADDTASHPTVTGVECEKLSTTSKKILLMSLSAVS